MLVCPGGLWGEVGSGQVQTSPRADFFLMLGWWVIMNRASPEFLGYGGVLHLSSWKL